MRSWPAILIGGGRATVGLVFAIKPVQSVSFLGVDQSTARRLIWLAEMTAARDVVLGVGTVVAGISDDSSRLWLLAGGLSDAADAAALMVAIKQRQVRPVTGVGVIAFALGASAIALATAAQPLIATIRNREANAHGKHLA